MPPPSSGWLSRRESGEIVGPFKRYCRNRIPRVFLEGWCGPKTLPETTRENRRAELTRESAGTKDRGCGVSVRDQGIHDPRHQHGADRRHLPGTSGNRDHVFHLP